MQEPQSIGKTIVGVLRLILLLAWICLKEIVYLVYPRPEKSLEGKVVLLTGAARGIGRIVAEKLARMGARCVLVDIDRVKNDKAASEIAALGFNAWSYACDISKPEQITQMRKWITVKLGPVDILINNAGIVNGQDILAIEPERVQRNFEVNTLSHFWMIREFLSSMKERGEGHIVATCSIAGILGTAFLTDYCSSKFAVRGLMAALEEELYCLGFANKIHLTTVCPLAVKTTMFEEPRTRFPWAMPILEPEYVADGIIRATVTNRREVVLPPYVGILNKLNSVLPAEACLELQRFMKYEVAPHASPAAKSKSQ